MAPERLYKGSLTTLSKRGLTCNRTSYWLFFVVVTCLVTMATNVSASKKSRKDQALHSHSTSNRNKPPTMPRKHIPRSNYTAARRSRIPDEQRLYQALMRGYQNSIRPVVNASKTLTVQFVLRLNQIIGLDERHQVLTTSVFIDQKWEDENLHWDVNDFNGIRTMRIPAEEVWLPDTFVFNNADDGSTGFMRGVHVLLDSTGVVTWPVPVKLKSSCKVDITYFPFDDQQCELRFGSWIYSIRWMDFISPQPNADLDQYVDNSEWELMSVSMNRSVEMLSNAEPRVDLTYRLHIRRRTFYYMFNIIVPCTMLSVLTLLTFWLPTTSGEKVTLGLSVFLAFSMFMVLIAEEVPATSESVPLIGIYLTAVMTMTSVSVIMAVIVINIYNKGHKYRAAPRWLCQLCFRFLSMIMFIKHDIAKLASTIKLPYERDEKDAAHSDSLLTQAYSRHRQQVFPYVGAQQGYMRPICQDRDRQPFEYGQRGAFEQSARNRSFLEKRDSRNHSFHRCSHRQRNRLDEEVDLKVSLIAEKMADGEVTPATHTSIMDDSPANPAPAQPSTSRASELQISEESRQKTIIAEWQRIAAVIDRLLFWTFFLATLSCYIVILVILPGTKPSLLENIPTRAHPMLNEAK